MEGDSNYISLREATKYCGYSQEYLSLRARYGKLKAMKFGRNWVTKKEWLDEYLKKTEEYNNNNNHSLKFNHAKKLFSPPANLPIASTPIIGIFKSQWKSLVVISVGVVLLTAGGVFGKESFENVFQDLDPIVREISQTGDIIFSKAFSLPEEFSEIKRKRIIFVN